MVFLIQNSQNRESLATQLKLDELIRAVERANNGVINIEEWSEEDLKKLQSKFRAQAEAACDRGELDKAVAIEEVAEAVEAAKDDQPVRT